MPGSSEKPIRLRFDRAKLREAGERAVSLITQRTQRGRDAEGKKFEPYSTKPFAMPAGGGGKQSALGRLKKKGELEYFTTKKGSLWAIITGGYAAYKEERYGQDGSTVNLTATGAMLSAMQVGPVVANADGGRVTINFDTLEAAEKAYYHNVAGAGKSKTKREFFGLTDAEADEVAERAGEAVTIEV